MRDFNLDLNINADAAKAIAKAMSECAILETSRQRTDRVLAALAKADLIIVPKPVGNAEAVREAVRTGNWSAVSERDLLAWRDAPREEEAAPADEGAIAALQADIATLQRAGVEHASAMALPPGTDVRAAGASSEGQDNLGLCLRSADDLAAGYDCRVELVGMDDARFPMSVEHDEGDHIVVTDRHSARVVGLVEAWHSDDGDPIVPKAWLEIVLGAWDAAKEPQQAA